MAKGDQTKNGKSFEYALAKTYTEKLRTLGINVRLQENKALKAAKGFFNSLSISQQRNYCEAANQTIDTIIRLEPGLTIQKKESDELFVYLNEDSEGAKGDVRDVIFYRKTPKWEIGFSAKNNNDAAKHSRLSSILDFGKEWFGVPCSQEYWDDISPIFSIIENAIKQAQTWNDLGARKVNDIYLPLLMAFRKELLKIYAENEQIPQKLILYLIGKYPFYKIIKDDSHNMVIVRAFNTRGELNKSICGIKPRYKTPKINLPTRIVELEMKPGSDNTLNMILDEGWEISFRIHNASTMVERSLKFDIKLLGNPPVLFTQHLFQNPNDGVQEKK